MCGYDYGPPPCFEYVDLGQYSDKEILDYIKHLCDYMNERNKKEEISETKEVEEVFNVDDIPF